MRGGTGGRGRRRRPRTGGRLSRSLGRRLPPALLDRLSQRDLPARLGVALPFVTVDADGRPHPMLVSYLEVRAYDASTVGLVIQASSGSAGNLAQRRTGTLLVVEPDGVFYLKLRALDGPLPVDGEPALGFFLLEVDEVLADAAADWEGALAITSAIAYRPVPTLDEPWARATRAALAAPRARA